MTWTPPELVGPFNRGDVWTLTCEGRVIPFVEASKPNPDDPEEMEITLDKRMSFGPFTEKEVNALSPLLAHCMAFAAGYPCFGIDQKINHFNCQISRIDLPTKLTPINGGKK